MHNDVVIGLTGVQAEYIRALLDSECNDVCAELGGGESQYDGTPKSDLEECAEMCELLIRKFERAIDEGIKRNLAERMR